MCACVCVCVCLHVCVCVCLHVCVWKLHIEECTERCSDYWHSKHVTLHVHSTLGIGAFDTFFPFLLCTLGLSQWTWLMSHIMLTTSVHSSRVNYLDSMPLPFNHKKFSWYLHTRHCIIRFLCRRSPLTSRIVLRGRCILLFAGHLLLMFTTGWGTWSDQPPSYRLLFYTRECNRWPPTSSSNKAKARR